MYRVCLCIYLCSSGAGSLAGSLLSCLLDCAVIPECVLARCVQTDYNIKPEATLYLTHKLLGGTMIKVSF